MQRHTPGGSLYQSCVLGGTVGAAAGLLWHSPAWWRHNKHHNMLAPQRSVQVSPAAFAASGTQLHSSWNVSRHAELGRCAEGVFSSASWQMHTAGRCCFILQCTQALPVSLFKHAFWANRRQLIGVTSILQQGTQQARTQLMQRQNRRPATPTNMALESYKTYADESRLRQTHTRHREVLGAFVLLTKPDGYNGVLYHMQHSWH